MIRPLDPLSSIKVKLGVLVTASCGVTALIVQRGTAAGYPARYTLPFAVLMSLAVTQVLAHGMTSPLREMTAAARGMAGGDYSRRVRTTSRDEVGELARAFTLMAADLAEADRQRREFVANVSHELRTPISALHALLENIADGVTPAQPRTLNTALDQTERLGRLITQLLDLSRIESGGFILNRAEFAVSPFIEAIVAQAQIGHPKVRFAIDAPEGLMIDGDRDRLAQVLTNLLDNAAVHGPPDGTVTITARRSGRVSGLVLEVTDEGPGIPAHERARVFERFSRGNGSYAADGGTGLGLAIARWAVKLHDGDIQVADTVHGCRIQVVIPATGLDTSRALA
jgi:signal transduction histidine kinase